MDYYDAYTGSGAITMDDYGDDCYGQGNFFST